MCMLIQNLLIHPQSTIYSKFKLANFLKLSHFQMMDGSTVPLLVTESNVMPRPTEAAMEFLI